MKKILYVYRTARGKKYHNFLEGKEPDHILYGLNYLTNKGYKVMFFDMAHGKFNILYWLFLPLQKLIIQLSSQGFRIDQAVLLIPKIRSADIVVTTTDSVGLPILFLKKMGFIKTPIIYISIGLINELEKRDTSMIFNFYKKILPEASKVICHSKQEIELYKKLIPQFKKRLEFIPFGIDHKFFNRPSIKRVYILSVGQDKSRDYLFLSKIATFFPKEKFAVVTQRSNVEGIYFSKNVKLYFNLPYDRVEQMYSQAKLLFLPLRALNRAGGQTSFLEGVAANLKIVIPKIEDIIEVYKKIVVSNKNIFMYKAGDIKDCISKLEQALRVKEKKFEFFEDYSSMRYGERISQIIEKL